MTKRFKAGGGEEQFKLFSKEPSGGEQGPSNTKDEPSDTRTGLVRPEQFRSLIEQLEEKNPKEILEGSGFNFTESGSEIYCYWSSITEEYRERLDDMGVANKGDWATYKTQKDPTKTYVNYTDRRDVVTIPGFENWVIAKFTLPEGKIIAAIGNVKRSAHEATKFFVFKNPDPKIPMDIFKKKK